MRASLEADKVCDLVITLLVDDGVSIDNRIQDNLKMPKVECFAQKKIERIAEKRTKLWGL